MESKNTAYLERLDHLRFYASAMVLLFHVGLWVIDRPIPPDPFRIPLIHEGHAGVQLFMVISGFILAVITFGKDIDPWRFYWNRVLRIYPLFVFVVALGHFSTPDPRPTATGLDFLMALLPIANLFRLKYGPLGGAFWSISVELQFYLLFPMLLVFLRRFGVRYYVGVIGFLLLLRAILFTLNGTVHQLSFYTIFGALDLFLIGMITGVLYKAETLGFLRRPAWFFTGIVGANVVTWYAFRHATFFHFDYRRLTPDGVSHHWAWIVWPTVEAIIFAGLVVAYLEAEMPLPFSSVLARLGRYSYSIYVWHTTVILVVLRWLPPITPYALGLFVVLPLTVLVSAISYHLIEAPFLSLRVTYTRRRFDEALVPEVAQPAVALSAASPEQLRT